MDRELLNFLNKLNLMNILKKKYFFNKYTKKVNTTLIILTKLGYIHSFQLLNNRNIIITLKYSGNIHAIRGIKVVSTNVKKNFINTKFFKSYNKYSKIKKNNGFYICSTNKGLITDIEAKLLNVGGQILFKIW